MRPAKIADVQGMMDVGRDSVATAHWSRQLYESLVASPSGQNAERFAWVVEDEPATLPEGAPSPGPEILGFLVVHRVISDWELENIVVKEPARRRGVGTRLMKELVAQARSQPGSIILLEARESNEGARGLYRKLGFEERGLRKSYYANPEEDAIMYHLVLH
ncbi:MAG: GNAT family N-acetyltransferase [Candidatus Sulfotelmatobacter sp.]